MAELETTKLNAESHLLLDQPLLRMPYHLSRNTFKSAQRALEHCSITKDLSLVCKSATKSSPSNTPQKTLSDLDAMISKMGTLKRKLETLHEDEQRHTQASKARIRHLQDLYEVRSLADVKYDEWSRVRLSRLLVDYLLRMGYSESAAQLARANGVEQLVDVEGFVQALRIERSLREGRSTGLALAWCKENAQSLKKMGAAGGAGSGLEFELRLQQYIEMVRVGHEEMARGNEEGGVELWMGMEGQEGAGASTGGEEKLVEARAHAKKFLTGTADAEVLGKAAGLLAYRPWDPVEPYASLYCNSRYEHLADLFLSTHHTLFSLPSRPLLHIALSAGLSALKTPSCHSAYTSSSANASSSTTTVCPICSTELNELARNVPYAHHTKSIVEADPVVLPNGHVYGRERLQLYNDKVGTERGLIKDPLLGPDGPVFREHEVRKVFIM